MKKITLNDVQYTAFGLAYKLFGHHESMPPYKTRLPGKLESCIGAVFQSYDGKDLYPNLVGKSAMLFYLMIKNHPFKNGNKRIAVMTLLLLLAHNHKWLKIPAQQIYEFAVWIAQSPPRLKNEVVSAIQTFISANIRDIPKNS